MHAETEMYSRENKHPQKATQAQKSTADDRCPWAKPPPSLDAERLRDTQALPFRLTDVKGDLIGREFRGSNCAYTTASVHERP